MFSIGSDPPKPSKVVGQHTVSRLLLRRWADAGEVAAFDLRTGRHRRRGVGGQGKVDGFVAFQAEATEELWQQTEANAPVAISAAMDGTLRPGSSEEATLRNLILLHLVRSRDLREMWDPTSSEQLARLATIANSPEGSSNAFEARYGIKAVGPEAQELGRKHFLDILEANFARGGVGFAENLLEHYERALEHFSGAQLEIGVLEDGELLIGDNPALTYDKDTRRAGLLGGAPILQSNTVLLPIGPKHLAALTNTQSYWDIGQDIADWLNRLQIWLAHDRVWFRPGSGLESFVADVRTRELARRAQSSP